MRAAGLLVLPDRESISSRVPVVLRSCCQGDEFAEEDASVSLKALLKEA